MLFLLQHDDLSDEFVFEHLDEYFLMLKQYEEYLEQSDNFYLQYSSIIRKKGIRFLGISSRRYGKSKIVKGSSYPIEMRYVSFPTPGNVDIYKNKVLQITWGDKILGILIESKEIAQDYRAYFEEVWKQGEK